MTDRTIAAPRQHGTPGMRLHPLSDRTPARRTPDDPRPQRPSGPTGRDGRPGRRTQPPAFNVPPLTLAIAGLILGIWLLIQILPYEVWGPVAERLVLVPARLRAVMAHGDTGWVIEEAATLLTYALIHVEAIHVFANLGFLLAFGSQCERQMGRLRYLTMVVASAIAGGLAQLVALGDASIAILGASAATSGMMGAFAWTLLTAVNRERRRFGIGIILAFGVINAIFAVMGGAVAGSGAAIAWEAHLAGFVTGMVFGVTDPVRRMLNGARRR